MSIRGGGWLLSAIVGLALAALPSLADARKYQPVENDGFEVKLPEGFKLTAHRGDPTGPQYGRWVYESPTKKISFRVAIRPFKGGNFNKLADDSYQRFLRRVEDPQVIEKKSFKHEGRDLNYRVFKGSMVKGDFMKEYLFLRLFIKTSSNRLVALTLAAIDEKLEEFMKMSETIMDSFELQELKKPAAKVPVPAKAGGKR